MNQKTTASILCAGAWLVLSTPPSVAEDVPPQGILDCSKYPLQKKLPAYCAAINSSTPEAMRAHASRLVTTDQVLDTSRTSRARGPIKPDSVIYPAPWDKVTHKYKVIPYRIQEPDVAGEAVREALCRWQQTTVVSFRPANDTDTDVIDFKTTGKSGKNDAAVGCFVLSDLPSRQAYIGGCLKGGFVGGKVGATSHEVGHLLGLKHEMVRSDRDQYFDVNLKKLASPDQFNLDTLETEKASAGKALVKRDVSADYDFASLMHYPPNEGYSFKKVTLPPNVAGPLRLLDKTVILLKEEQITTEQVGRSLCVSQTDANSINLLYFGKDDGP